MPSRARSRWFALIFLRISACILAIGSGCGRVVSKVGEYAPEVKSPGKGNSLGGGHAGGSGFAGNPDAGSSWANVVDAHVPSTTDDNCTFTLEPAQRHRLDMYIVMDSNIALAFGLWNVAIQGVRTFVQSPSASGTGVGIVYYGTECGAAAYDTAAVEVAELPGNQNALLTSTQNNALVFKASEMLPALQGGLMHQKRRATTVPDAKQIVTMISDGFAGDVNPLCPLYKVDDVVGAASNGLTAPRVETHVIEMSTLGNGSTDLDRVAAAGGSSAAVRVGAQNVPAETAQALEIVRQRALPCDYKLPSDTSHLDAIGVGVPENGQIKEVPRVASAADCLNLPGWYYDDPAAPTQISLCTATCDATRTRDAQFVSMLLGCAPQTR